MKSDCWACTEAKQTHEPFGNNSEHKTEIGELTHTNLWGPYSVTSINGNKYYISFINDASKEGKVEFLKTKDETNQLVKNHFVQLKALSKWPRALWVDHGKEFNNADLINWCEKDGIEVEFTAPYSLSQSGVAEQLN